MCLVTWSSPGVCDAHVEPENGRCHPTQYRWSRAADQSCGPEMRMSHDDEALTIRRHPTYRGTENLVYLGVDSTARTCSFRPRRIVTSRATGRCSCSIPTASGWRSATGRTSGTRTCLECENGPPYVQRT